MNIRLATLPHAAALAAIEQTQPQAAGWGKAGFASELAQACSHIWCAERGGELVGFVAVRAVADSAEILNVAVHAHHTGRGVGSNLLNYVLQELARQGVRQVSLEVAQDNAAALALYTRAGFVRCSVRKDFYAPGRDGLILGKEL